LAFLYPEGVQHQGRAGIYLERSRKVTRLPQKSGRAQTDHSIANATFYQL